MNLNGKYFVLLLMLLKNIPMFQFDTIMMEVRSKKKRGIFRNVSNGMIQTRIYCKDNFIAFFNEELEDKNYVLFSEKKNYKRFSYTNIISFWDSCF